jgi:hypothetical protein
MADVIRKVTVEGLRSARFVLFAFGAGPAHAGVRDAGCEDNNPPEKSGLDTVRLAQRRPSCASSSTEIRRSHLAAAPSTGTRIS